MSKLLRAGFPLLLLVASLPACAGPDDGEEQPGQDEVAAESAEIAVYGRDRQGRSLLGYADPGFNGPSAPVPADYALTPSGLRTAAGATPATGATIILARDVVRYRAAVTSSDVYGRTRYAVTYSIDGGANFKLLCKNQEWAYAVAGPIAASGVHDLSTAHVQFACRTSAAAKCVRFGYAPLETAGDPRFFESCMRMVRADYCGNGRSFTVDGTEIGYFDRRGFAARFTPDDGGTATTTAPMAFEAGWRETGAVCLSKKRWQTMALSPCSAQLPDPRQDPAARFCDDLGTGLPGSTAPPASSIDLLFLTRLNADVYNESTVNDRGLWSWGKNAGSGRVRRMAVTSGFWGGASSASTVYPPEDFGYTVAPQFVASLFAQPRTGTVPLYLYRHTSGRYETTSQGLLHLGFWFLGVYHPSPWTRVNTVGHVFDPAQPFPAIEGLAGVKLYQYTQASTGDKVIAAAGAGPAGFTQGRFEGWGIRGEP